MTGSLVRWQAHGSGEPVTLVVPGLGATAGEARIPASGVPGSRVVVTLPGHGDAPDAPPDFWDYGVLAGEVGRVADEVGASRAIGVSLGAGALTRLVAERPDRFERLALLLPAAFDQGRDEATAGAMLSLADAVDEAESDGGRRLHSLLAGDLPEGVAVGDYVEQRAAALRRLPEALRTLPRQVPVPDASSLGRVTAQVLVIGATRDPLHPETAAKATSEAFRGARLRLLDSAVPMLTHRRELRMRLVEFLR